MAPLLQFKAGRALRDGETNTVKPKSDRGLISLEEEDGLLHFYYKSITPDHPTGLVEDDLILFPGDVAFAALPSSAPQAAKDRVHVLKFNSSSARHFYWSQDADGWDADKFQARHAKLNELVGAEVEDNAGAGGMEIEQEPAPSASTAPAAYSSVLETPAPSRSAAPIAAPGAPKKAFGSEQQMAQLQDILANLTGGAGAGGAGGLGGLGGMLGGQQAPEFTLSDVLPASVAQSLLTSLPDSALSHLASFLPTSTSSSSSAPLLPTSTPAEQRASLARALSSPEFTRALASLDRALRTGATGPLMGSLGLGEREARGTEEFMEGVQRQGEEERRKREREGEQGEQGGEGQK
ncbi:hypothetical protein JCM8097_001126 [Rhodosporidiobolus ruineniae]